MTEEGASQGLEKTSAATRQDASTWNAPYSQQGKAMYP